MAVPPLRVMLAEDNLVSQTLLCRLLESMGHSVTLAEHGAQALELVATQDFDVALMDMQMPIMDGETATRLIRMLPGDRARLPVVALTADAGDEHRVRYHEAGLDACLAKPVTAEALAQTLKRMAGAPADAPEPDLEAEADASGLPVLDHAYLEDMRQWVGEATVLALLAGAPASFDEELAAITRAWESGDKRRLRENAHRLKGAAGSVGCRRLADVAQSIQHEDGPGDRRRLDRLTAEAAAAAVAITAWRPA